MQQFIHLPANIQCSPQISKQPKHPSPIGYGDIQFLQQALGLLVVFPSLAICGTRGSIQVRSLQVTITALLPWLWWSSSFVSSQRSSPFCADWDPVAKPCVFSFHTPSCLVMNLKEFTLFIYKTSSSSDHLISCEKNCVWNKHQIPHEKTVCDAQNVSLVDTNNFLKMHAHVFPPVCWGAIFDVSCGVFTFVVESVVINC